MFTLEKLSLASMKAKINSLKKDQSGQGMVEYVLIIALIAIVVIASFPTLTNAISAAFTNVASHMGGAS
jgi:pilus assembly protein Flp/PilA